MNKKNVGWGLVLILLAVYLIVSRLGFWPNFPFFTVVFTIVFGYGVINGIAKRSFVQSIMSLAILGCIYDKQLHIEPITPWILLISALLISAGLEMIFKNIKKKNAYGNTYHFSTEKTTDFVDGDYVRCENTFGSTCKYINSEHFTDANIENTFGTLNVYFDNAIMANGTCNVKVENTFGETNLYFPKTWRVDCQQSAAFGDIKFRGQGSLDADAPLVRLNAEASFGSIQIYFN